MGLFSLLQLGQAGAPEPTDDCQPQGGEQRDCTLPDAMHGALSSPWGVFAAHHPAPSAELELSQTSDPNYQFLGGKD